MKREILWASVLIAAASLGCDGPIDLDGPPEPATWCVLGDSLALQMEGEFAWREISFVGVSVIGSTSFYWREKARCGRKACPRTPSLGLLSVADQCEDADLFLLMIGTNDMFFGTHPAAVAEHILELVDSHILDERPIVAVTLPGPSEWLEWRDWLYNVDQYALLDHDLYYSADFVHLSELGRERVLDHALQATASFVSGDSFAER